LARTGSVSGNGSGDLLLAFSTSKAEVAKGDGNAKVEMLSNDDISPHFDATVQATEEAIINALIAAETMTGIDGHRVLAIPHRLLIEVMRKYNRLNPS
jgi:D-aminopeptidase